MHALEQAVMPCGHKDQALLWQHTNDDRVLVRVRCLADDRVFAGVFVKRLAGDLERLGPVGVWTFHELAGAGVGSRILHDEDELGGRHPKRRGPRG